MLQMVRKYSILSFIILITIVLAGCQNLEDAVDETNKKLEFNKNVTMETFEKIELGDKENASGGTTYVEAMEFMGEIEPQYRAEYEENGKTVIEAKWWRDEPGNKFISVNFLNEKAIGKFQEGLE